MVLSAVEILRSQSLPMVLEQEIERVILSGEFGPGDRINEKELALRFGISRGPIREALKRLAAEGVVTLNQNRGAYVRSLTRSEVSDLLKVVEVVTGLVARLATEKLRTGPLRDAFIMVSDELMAFERLGDSQAFIDKRRDFHHILIEASGNVELQRIMPLMQIHLLRLQFQTRLTPTDRRRQFSEYRAIRDTVLAGNALRAERVMRIHIRRTRLSISRLPLDAFSMIER